MKSIMSADIEAMNAEQLKEQCLEYYWGIAELNGYWGSKVWELEEKIRLLEIELLKRIEEPKK